MLLAALVLAALLGAPATASARTIWVDPGAGSDARSGASPTSAIRTLQEAWNRIPRRRALTEPYVVNLRAGTYPAALAPTYWEERRGTARAPITLRSIDGVGRAQLPSINMFEVHHLTLDGVRIRSPFIAMHCERCSHLTLRRSAFVGAGDHLRYEGPQETIKVNQSSDLAILDSYVAGATDNAIDLVAVHRARIERSTIAHARDWCAYAKGGSADITFAANHVYGCGTGGITAGQGTGFEFMVAPWLQHEAYGVQVRDNLLHDIEGAALGVNGGHGVQVAGNTAYRTGTRDHLLEVVFGERSCDGDAAACTERAAQGGWGPRAPGGDPDPIGNREVTIAHNLLVNPVGVRSRYTHFAVYAPRDARSPGVPSPQRADTGLRILGNVVWDGPGEVELGLGGDDQGCAPAHATCAPDLVRAANNVNRVEPRLQVVLGRVPVAAAGTDAGSGAGIQLPPVDWSGLPSQPRVPAVALPTTLGRDRAGRPRTPTSPPGAYVAAPPLASVVVRGASPAGRVTARSVARCTTSPCSIRVLRGDWVELVARPAAGRSFAGWGGACARQRGPVCVVHAAAARTSVVVHYRRG
jgi:hypothetical protein